MSVNKTNPSPPPFWKTKKMAEFSREEWESLCDRCGLCCLCKIEYQADHEVCYTNVCCAYLDRTAFSCTAYTRRNELNRNCAVLQADNIGDHWWLPDSCAYKLVHAGRDLPFWHPLVSGDPSTIEILRYPVRNRLVSEMHVHPDQLDYHIIDLYPNRDIRRELKQLADLNDRQGWSKS